MKQVKITCVVAAVLMAVAGCSKQEPATVEFGKASAVRKAEFAAAVASALRGFEDLDSQGVQIDVSPEAETSVPQITVRGGSLQPEALGKALGVVLTNMSFKYPGIGFMATGDSGWRILMPDDMKIPVEGEFDFGLK